MLRKQRIAEVTSWRSIVRPPFGCPEMATETQRQPLRRDAAETNSRVDDRATFDILCMLGSAVFGSTRGIDTHSDIIDPSTDAGTTDARG